MEALNNSESEIKSWLKIVLKHEDIENFSVKILGNSEKGDGYVGDIVFVSLIPTSGHSGKKYDFVLKCSKRSQLLRDKIPIKEVFYNEIYIYDTVLPDAFTQFQLDKGITDLFDSVPKYYGKFSDNNMEVIVFEDLKKAGYSLWDKRKPLTRKHIEMVVREYAKFHAVSVAMKGEKPKQFEELVNGLDHDLLKLIMKTENNTPHMCENFINEVHDLLKDDLDDHVLKTWAKLKEQVKYIFDDMPEEINGLKVILHGDCWNNNFLYKYDSDNHNSPTKVAVLDWQISRYSSPILDLSYFVFTCISEEDLDNLENILRYYYEMFSQFLKKLGSNYVTLYSLEKFLEDWKKYCKFGIVMAAGILKACSTDKDEVVDIADAVESGGDLTSAFTYDVKDKTAFKRRARYIVKHAVENCLI